MIELSMPDILAWGNKVLGKEIDPKDYGTLRQMGTDIRRLCEENRLEVLMLQPFANFEGWSKGSEERREAFERARGWSSIMEAVGTDMLQVGWSIGVFEPSSQPNRLEVQMPQTSRQTLIILHETSQSLPT